MSPTNVSHAVDWAIARAVAGQPQYAPCVDESLGAALSAEMLASDQVVRRGIATGRQTYKLHEDRFGAHMWLFSLTWSVAAPSVVAMVLTEEIPDLDLSSGLVFSEMRGRGIGLGFGRASGQKAMRHRAGMRGKVSRQLSQRCAGWRRCGRHRCGRWWRTGWCSRRWEPVMSILSRTGPSRWRRRYTKGCSRLRTFASPH